MVMKAVMMAIGMGAVCSAPTCEDAIKHAVTRAEKQTAKELDVDPKDVDEALQEDKALQETVKEMQPGRRGQRRRSLGQRLATHPDG
jgi:hypothetical protein